MNGRWKPGDDAPARVGRMWTKTRSGAGGARTVAIAAGAVAVVLVATVAIALANADSGDSPTSAPSTAESLAPHQDYPADGAYEVRVAHSELCATTGPEPGNPDRVVLVQRACAGDPNLLLENLGEGRFRVRLAEPDYVGKDCLAVDEPGTEPGLLFAAWSCDGVPRQVFSLEPVGDGLFRIALPAGGMCVDVLARDVAAGAQFDTEPCAEDVPSQQFQFIP